MAYDFTPEQIGTSLFPPQQFTVKGERFMWFAPYTPGVGYTMLVARANSRGEWESFYGPGRELTVAEIKDRGGAVGFVQLHVKEVNSALAAHFKTSPEAQELAVLVADITALLGRVIVVDTQLKLSL
jgi:hypothetical protein